MIASVWEVMGTTLSIAAWGRDSAALRRATAQALDSVRRIDSLMIRGTRFTRPIVDQLRSAWTPAARVEREPDWQDALAGHALDRAALALTGVADSALLSLGGQFLWIGPPTRREVGIADPRNSLLPRGRVDLRSGSLQTLARDGRSVTVLAARADDVAAWSSVLVRLECDSALALVQRGPPGLVCVDSAGIRWSPGLEGQVAVPQNKAP